MTVPARFAIVGTSPAASGYTWLPETVVALAWPKIDGKSNSWNVCVGIPTYDMLKKFAVRSKEGTFAGDVNPICMFVDVLMVHCP